MWDPEGNCVFCGSRGVLERCSCIRSSPSGDFSYEVTATRPGHYQFQVVGPTPKCECGREMEPLKNGSVTAGWNCPACLPKKKKISLPSI
jgi:hypothetical protein